MKLISISLSLVLLLCNFTTLLAQGNSYCNQSQELYKTLNKFHYSPTDIDDDFAEFVFNKSIEALDPFKLLFSHADIEALDAHKHSIDNYLLDDKCDFIEELTEIYKQNLGIFDRMSEIQIIAAEYDSEEQFDFESRSYAQEFELIGRWEEYLKLNLLISYFQFKEIEESSYDDFKAYCSDQGEEIKEEMICTLKESLGERDGEYNEVGEAYLEAIASAFDPHSMYLSPSKESEFGDHLSSEALSFGLEVYKNQEGDFEVYEIIPGGAAWNSNQVNEGDLINSIILEDDLPIDLGCMSEEDLFELTNEHNELTFSIIKQDGERLKVNLKKEKLEVQENIINSFVLSAIDSSTSQDAKSKIGYIYLPSFYTAESYGRYTPDGCAADVAKELIKLKSEGIDGLILDLRNNGGGSMYEANRLAGNFIDFGATCIADYKGEDPQSIKDMDRGMVFSKPLVVLVNSNSASASELFAATMQDYNRGLVIGSNTFGKATIQTILPIEANRFQSIGLIQPTSDAPEGYVKLTIGKFFRVDGSSHQLSGVSPDIRLFNEGAYSESTLPRALSNTSIDKKTYFRALGALPIEELKERQAERKSDVQEGRANSSNFRSIPLGFEAYTKFLTIIRGNDLEEEQDQVNLLEINSPAFALENKLETDFDKERRERLIEKIQNDIYISESVLIISDLIQINQSK
ncbi:MAG: hypothetical protein CMP59_12575 [Flavobacteriales bacterium]|nr:hypothetical protein [Flavobacteriales bacterium]|tara:strand:+ start:804 stop:2870 length:2067 start_codon:yes stop_codon:yes gene_type:complete